MTNLSFALPSDCGRRTALLDSNLLLVAVTASTDQRLLTTFKRVRSFREEDVRLLLWLASQFRGLVTSAYVLAEVSNLANELTGQKRDLWFEQLALYARLTPEEHIPSEVVGKSPLLTRFGVTDAALTILAEKHVLITAEFRLSGHLQERGLSVINFNHLRPLWLSRSYE